MFFFFLILFANLLSSKILNIESIYIDKWFELE